MKFLVIVTLFALVAVQVCQSSPIPDDDKVDAPEKKDEAVAPAAEAASHATEVKAETEPKADAAEPKAAEDAAPAAPAEEKKD